MTEQNPMSSQGSAKPAANSRQPHGAAMTGRDADADSSLTIHPAYAFGAVCVGSTAIPASIVAGRLWAGDTLTVIAADYGISRRQAVTACWWGVRAAVETAPSRRNALDKQIVERWDGWESEAYLYLAGRGGRNPADCPLPPGVEE